MRKTITIALFVLICLLLAFDIFSLIYGIIDINNTLDRLASKGASGIDYFGLGWSLGIGLFLASAVGLILSLVTQGVARIKVIKRITSIMTVAFLVLLATGILVFMM